MKMARAKEIVNSPDSIPVLYEDKSIWITSLNEGEETADITTGCQFEERITVPVNKLEEVHNKH